MLGLFKELAVSKSKKITYDSLLDGLTKLTSGELSKQSYNSIAQCIAVVVATNDAGRGPTVEKFVKDIKAAKTDNLKLLALYCTAEIGTRADISDVVDLKKNILASFESPSEEIKSAASVAFGCVACCNMAKFLPEILSEVNAHPKRKYLLLGSLREIIVRLSGTKEGKDILTPHFEQLMGLLFEHTSHEEEGTRNVVSECLGKLALINPEPVVLALKERTKDKSALTRACVTSAVKFTIFEKPLPVDKVLSKNITSFLDLLNDAEINVRKAVMLSLNYVAHHKPGIVRDALPKYLPAIYDQSRIKPELIREVELGPFKHKEDGGLDTRQATFECMYTLLESCLTRIELQEFISKMVSGLGDEYDVQMLNHLIIIRLAKKAGSALLGSLELLIDPLKACVTSVAKDVNVAQLVERNNELIKSALRAIAAVGQIQDLAETTPKFHEFMKNVVMAGELGKIYAEIIKGQAERQ
jgi:cullin-associated NEDD8-dissociated protein 1